MSTSQRKKREPFITLTIEGNYKDFKDFYDNNKEVIYRGIVETFEGMKTDRRKKLTLLVLGKICDFEWDTEFHFSKTDTKTLLRDVMPFFEQIEDYETCFEIKKLHDCLTI